MGSLLRLRSNQCPDACLFGPGDLEVLDAWSLAERFHWDVGPLNFDPAASLEYDLLFKVASLTCRAMGDFLDET